jgi:hypothetical protein
MFGNLSAGLTRVRQNGANTSGSGLKMRRGGLLSVIVLVWLLIGVLAAYQRDYFKSAETNCASVGTTALTVLVGPLNYAGVNPKVTDCNLPKPSQ